MTYQDQEGNPVTRGDIAMRKKEIAAERCKAMELEIKDQLIESDYHERARTCIHDSVVIGTGIIKGPVVKGHMNRVYKQLQGQEGFQILMERKFQPAVEVVRPWDFFPDMSASSVKDAEYVFERRYMSRKQMRQLVQREGFMPEQVVKALNMTPRETQHVSSYMNDIRQLAGLNEDLNDTRYEMWEYHGPIPHQVLIDAGMADPEEEENPLAEVSGVVHYCAGVVLSVKLNLIDADADLPYHVFNWVQDDSCIFGFGLPRITRNEQSIINTTWRMILDNGAITAGPQIGVKRRHVDPVNGGWELAAFGVWDVKDSAGSIEDAISAIEFNSHIQELIAIYQTARVQFDEVCGVPMLQQGEQGQTTQTLGGMSILMNAANTVRRNQVKAWDDDVTKPLIRGFYDFNMIFHPNDEIKGDYQVQARGTGALLVREQVSNGILNLINFASPNPMFQHILAPKARDLLEKWAEGQSLAGVIPSQDELDAHMQQMAEQEGEGEQDPQLMVEQMRAQLQQAKLQHEGQLAQMKMQAEAQIKSADLQVKQMALQVEQEKSVRQERIEVMKLAEAGKIKQAEMAQRLKELEVKQATDLHKFNAELALKQAYSPDHNVNYGLE